MTGKIRIDLIFVIVMSLIAIRTDAQQIKESNNMKKNMDESVYNVNRLEGKITIVGAWEKVVWKNVPALEITNYMGDKPQFLPTTFAKLLYDEKNIYGIFQVQDRYVQCLVQETNGHVSGDSCVEFFFSPDNSNPLFYFNLEINCGGVPLLQFVTVPRKEYPVSYTHLAITPPNPWVKTTATFYKTASTTSNPHYLTWSKVDNSIPDFHLPQFFGTLVFK